jgi:uroporphyrinogen-III synthase
MELCALNDIQMTLKTVVGCSLIDISQIPIRKYTKADWVFFSSKHAVRQFMQQSPDVDGCRFAAVGKATAEELRKFGKRADFIGDADDTRMTGKKFAAMAGSKSILFPQAKESMRTIQLQVPSKSQVIDLIVYETIKKIDGFEHPSEGFDMYVFTSPSNVDTFHERHRITAQAKVVAMGDATANALRKRGVKIDRMPASFDDLGLLQAVSFLF